ncbi:sulfatase-like hydrolase/transferase [Haloarcula japonica]|uniref:sulfatase-like hydrolase/transferase n=1 Tax=Haloarcula japonica TaxID=29282 RepID=UPI0039F6687E
MKEAEHPVILLTVDSLRADYVSKEYLPKSRRVLDTDFVEFTNAKSYGVATPFAFPGIIAGMHPLADGKIPDESTTIAEAIPGESVGLANNVHLRPERGYSRGFSRFEEYPTSNREKERGLGDIIGTITDNLVDKAQNVDIIRNSSIANRIHSRLLSEEIPIAYRTAPEMVDIVKDAIGDDVPALVWGHWMDPHHPYHPETAVDPPSSMPSVTEIGNILDKVLKNPGNLTAEEGEIARRLYAANIRYYDKHFANLLSWIQDKPWYDDAFIAIVSDHGEYFGEHGLYFHEWTHDPHNEAINTPLWVKYPEQENGGDNYNHLVGHGDILATIESCLLNSNSKAPAHTTALQEKEERHIVSVSNVSKRLTESSGVHFVRRSGEMKTRGETSEDGKQFLEGIQFPECRNSKGEAKGIKKAEREQRLQNLGYLN